MSSIGVIGEDATDCKTLAVLIRRIINAPPGAGVGIHKRYPTTGGCSMLRRKAEAYIKELSRSGCQAVVIAHDLDRNPITGNLKEEAALREDLEKIAVPSGVQRCICIPIEEIEAWFWSDQDVLDLVAKGHAKQAERPDRLIKPKEELEKNSRKAHHKAVYSTNVNERLAEKLSLAKCAQRCKSFADLAEFVIKHFGGSIY